MAQPKLPSVSRTGKRHSLADELNNTVRPSVLRHECLFLNLPLTLFTASQDFDDESFLQLMNEVTELIDKTKNFRWHADKTQKDQNYILATYENVLCSLKVFSPKDSDAFRALRPDEKEKLMFPPPRERCSCPSCRSEYLSVPERNIIRTAC